MDVQSPTENLSRFVGALRRTRWRSCHGVQLKVGQWALELWHLPALTYVPPHHHDFDGKFFKLFGKGTINKGHITKMWPFFDFRVYNIRKGERHWLQNDNLPLIFVNIQKHTGAVTSAGENFVE